MYKAALKQHTHDTRKHNLKISASVFVRMIKVCSGGLFWMDVIHVLVFISWANLDENVILWFL